MRDWCALCEHYHYDEQTDTESCDATECGWKDGTGEEKE